MSTINIFQVSLEIWGIVLSLILAVSTSSTVFRLGGVLKKTWTLLLLNCMLLSCDSLAYVYRGDPSSIGLIMTRFNNFGVFFIEGILVWRFTYLIQMIITGQKRISMKSTPIVIVLICVAAQLLGSVLTPFTNLYYSFDAQNYYVRGNWGFLSFLLLGIALAVNVFEIVKSKQQLSEKIRHTFISMAAIIALSILIQFIFYGISLINIAISLVTIVLFLELLADNREQEFMRHISKMEDVINELNKKKSKEDLQ